MDINLQKVTENKKAHLDLRLLGDEQELMIDRYLERGERFTVRHGAEVLALCAVTREAEGFHELKNLAVRLDTSGRA